MKQFNINLQLTEEDGCIEFNENDDVNITYKGYNYMNNIVNASVHMPDTFLIDGVEKENPFIVSNENGEIIEVTATAIAFCKFNGEIVSASATVKMNTEVYLTNDLMQLIAIDKSVGVLAKKGVVPMDDRRIARDINSELEIVVNLSNDKVIKAFSNYQENKARGERRIISIAQRNALKKLPPFAVALKNITGMPGNRTGEVSLTLYGANNDQKVIDVLSNAKAINAKVMTKDLIDISTGEITTVGDVMNLKNVDSNDNLNVEVSKETNSKDKNTTKEPSEDKKENSHNENFKNESNSSDSTPKKEVNEERAELIAKYRKLKAGTFDKAARLLYPNKGIKELNTVALRMVIKAAEKMI